MKEALKNLLVMLIALTRTPADEEDAIAAQKAKIEDHKATIHTLHGDSELNDPQVIELIDDLTEVAATATPDSEYAEVPDAEEEAPEDADSDKDQETTEGEEASEDGTEEKEEAPKHETALQKKRRLEKEKKKKSK